jgi:phage terminase large subunit
VKNRGPYEIRGGQLELMGYHGPEAVISGAAGTGKSLAALARLHFICESVPGVRCLIVRKTRESLTESGLVTFEEKIIPVNHPIVLSGGSRRMRQSYRYPNGSEIILGGMDKPSKVLSTEYDLVFCQECTELKEEDWETLITRLRNGKLPYQSIYGDCNPDSPTHWIPQRAATGKLKLFYSKHEDNPALYNPKTGWTKAGQEYLARLEQLTGPRKQRLCFGRWVQAEGVVYEDWDRAVHIVPKFHIDPEWPRYMAIDFGYTNPFVCLFAAMDPDGRIYVYREIYKSKTLVEDHAQNIRRLIDLDIEEICQRTGQPKNLIEKLLIPRAIYCDHDAEDRATLEKYLRLGATPAKKDVSSGIQAVQVRLRKQPPDNRPRLFFFEDILVSRDRDLAEKKHTTSIIEEFDSYIWEDNGKDKPTKEFDHAMDALRYLVYNLDMNRSALWEPPIIPTMEEERTRLRPGETGGRSRLFGR